MSAEMTPAVQHFISMSFIEQLAVALIVLGLGAVGTLLAVVVRVLVSTRDTLRDMVAAIRGTTEQPGLLLRVTTVEDDTQEHREWLIAAGLDRRSGRDRRDG